MELPDKYREGWIKFAVGETSRAAFTEGTKGRLYFLVPYLRPGAVDASVWRLDGDGVVFRLDGPAVAPPPLAAVSKAHQLQLSGQWVWVWPREAHRS
jgi:hypothetical protein